MVRRGRRGEEWIGEGKGVFLQLDLLMRPTGMLGDKVQIYHNEDECHGAPTAPYCLSLYCVGNAAEGSENACTVVVGGKKAGSGGGKDGSRSTHWDGNQPETVAVEENPIANLLPFSGFL
mmetsp:Transcript_23189/g.41816  ORF Transcript_23189/g.41816 Transcript_23189/m.41816 type:complete len:120 (-) Transcript_23189:425-784(-)